MKKMFKRLTAMTMAMAMLLSFGMTALANDLTEEEVNTILADHGFSAEAIEAIDIADKATMARQILAGTHSFEENTEVEYFSINENNELVMPVDTGLSSYDLKITISGSKVTEYGEFAYILYYITTEWIYPPIMTLEDVIAVSWEDEFDLVPNSYKLKSYDKNDTGWTLVSIDNAYSKKSGSNILDYWNLPSDKSKAQVEIKLKPNDSCPTSGSTEIEVNYAHKLLPDNFSIDASFGYGGISYSGGACATIATNYIKTF